MNVIEAINSRHSYRGKYKPDAVEVVGEWAWINGFRMPKRESSVIQLPR